MGQTGVYHVYSIKRYINVKVLFIFVIRKEVECRTMYITFLHKMVNSKVCSHKFVICLFLGGKILLNPAVTQKKCFVFSFNTVLATNNYVESLVCCFHFLFYFLSLNKM